MSCKPAVAALLALSLYGCSTIHFVNGPEPAASLRTTDTRWHHTVLLQLIEVSDPVNLRQLCGGQGWARVTTERRPLNLLAGYLDTLLIDFDLWEPWNVDYACRAPTAKVTRRTQ
jgi:hypothetical protein